MKVHHDKLWEILLGKPGEYELKAALILNALDAIKNQKMHLLYAPITTFNPHHEEKVSEFAPEIVRKYAAQTGVVEYVKSCMDND